MPYIRADYRVLADQHDIRDFIYVPVLTPLKDQVDLRLWTSAVENQSHLGSCVGNAIVGAYELIMNKQAHFQFVDLSRLFIYYNARLLEGAVDTDEGAYLRDGIKGIVQYGICSEAIWPYIIHNFAITPTIASYDDAKTRTIKNYFRLLKLEHILDALNNDHPVVVSMQLYSQFNEITNLSPVLKLPSADQSTIGGHAMCLVGYDMNKQCLLARNSFGPFWGEAGYCWIPFSYARDEFMDSWIFDINLST